MNAVRNGGAGSAARSNARATARDSAGAGLQLAVQYASTRECPARDQVRRWVRAALALAGVTEATLLVRYVDAREARVLNRSWRNRDYATNVLTFDYREGDDGGVQADIIVCAPVVEREARAQRKAAADHHAHLVVHGVLHACGHDHEEDEAAAAEMEGLEVAILRRFRIADPYQSEEG